MDHVKALKCVLCGKEYSPQEVEYTCPICGREGILEVLYDYSLISRRISPRSLKNNSDFSIWRYKPLLPLKDESPTPPLHVGWTPLYHPQRLNEKLHLKYLYIKDDGRNPTASLKDRASAVGIVKAMEKGAREVTCASTGNAASSWAGAAASVGLKSYIFVPQTAPQAKMAQLLIFGAEIFPVKGTYDQAFDLCIQASEKFEWYNRNTAFNPYLVEGKKTVALEISEQLNWITPDKVFVSVGDGCIISGVFKGFSDLLSLGWIDCFPQIIGVQAEGASPLYKAWKEGKPFEPVEPKTIADSISVGIPRNRAMALRDLKAWGGKMLTVTDGEILEAMRILGRETGVFGEPAGVASFAGLIKALNEGMVEKNEKVVVIISGNGLKDIASALKAVKMPHPIEPSLEGVEEALKRRPSL